MGNHNPYIEEEQTTQWPKEKVQKDKQRSTKDVTRVIFYIKVQKSGNLIDQLKLKFFQLASV